MRRSNAILAFFPKFNCLIVPEAEWNIGGRADINHWDTELGGVGGWRLHADVIFAERLQAQLFARKVYAL